MITIMACLSLFFTLLCYINLDPMKSCLFLIFSLIALTPYLSLGNQIWYSYFVCLVFLSGIFVILVYFSSLSKYNFYKVYFSYCIFLGFFLLPNIVFFTNYNLYLLKEYFILYLWLFLSLLVFLNFCSYMLNYSGALRKV